LGGAYTLMQKNIKPDSKESNELEIPSIRIKKYENKNFPILKPNPIEAIRFLLEQMNISEAELTKILGLRSIRSEILSGKRKLNLSMIHKLNEELKIPADVLIRIY
jgi:HTH-type transcriptional regulator / antitoxin HigA